MPTITITNVFVDDQSKALDFYTDVLGFVKKHDVPVGVPAAQFTVPDVRAEYERLTDLGVRFTQRPLDHGPVTTAVLDDTCGNLVQLVGPTSSSAPA